jgi:uncharacterized integral membrane protein
MRAAIAFTTCCALPLKKAGSIVSMVSPGWCEVFAFRKVVQPMPPDICDKSVFDYLAKKREKKQQAA